MDSGKMRRIFAMAREVGIESNGGHGDELHALVYEATRSESIKSLTDEQAQKVIDRLMELMKLSNHKQPLKSHKRTIKEAVPGMMTVKQQSLAKLIMSNIANYDPREINREERMKGAIKKILDIDVDAKEPFRWISRQDGSRLIEMLKKYEDSAARKAARTR